MGRGCRAGPSSLEGRPGAARPSQPVDAGRPLPAPFSPTPPLSPGPPGGPPLRSGFERCSPAWRPTAATAPAFRTQEQGAARWGRQGLRCPSGRLRRPARAERDSSRRRTSPRRAGGIQSGHVQPIWESRRPLRPSALVDSELSTSRQTPGEHISGSGSARADWRPCSGCSAALLRRPFGAPVSCPHGGSSPRPTSARVGAFRPLRPTPRRCCPTLRRPPDSPRAASLRSGRR